MGIPTSEFDRLLFAFTVASHIILVSLSIGLAILLSAFEFLRARYKDPFYGALVRRLSRPFVISFGVGTASGIVMAIELVNLFPGFMKLVSETGVIAIFYVEIFAFFVETVFLVIYVYFGHGFRGRYSRWLLTLPIVAGTLLSAVLIVMVNAWMNTPNGFDLSAFRATGAVTGVNPWAPFVTVSTGYEVLHVVSAVPLTGLMLIGGYFAVRYVRSGNAAERTMFLKGLRVITTLSLAFVVLAIYSGVLEIENLYTFQPLKYAAIELNANPGTNLPITIYGSLSGTTVVGGLQIPGLQGILTHHTMLPGLSQYPSSEWPPLIIHDTFDTTVLGGVLLGFFLLAFTVFWGSGRRPYDRRLWAYGFAGFSVLTVVIMESGWMTDEIGRQPWIVYNVMTVSSAANTSSALVLPGLCVIAFYAVLLPATFYFMVRVFNSRSLELDLTEEGGKADVNY